MSDFITEEIDGKIWLKSYTGHDAIVKIPEGIQVIDGDDSLTEDDPRTSREGAFSGNHEITSIYIPKSVETVRMYAFSGCSNLKSVHCENELSYFEAPSFGYETTHDAAHTEILECAFDKDNEITEFDFPNSRDEKILDYVFNHKVENK